MIVKYEVRTKAKTSYFYTYKNAEKKAMSLAKLGYEVEIYKVTYKLYQDTEELIYKSNEEVKYASTQNI